MLDKKSIFGQSINTNATFNTADKPASIFGTISAPGKAVEGGSIFGGTPVFGGTHTLFSGSANNSDTKSIFGYANSTQNAGNGTGNLIFGPSTFSNFDASNKSTTTQTSIFSGGGGGGGGGLNATNTNSILNNSKKNGTQSGAAVSTVPAPSFADLSTKAGGIDFASLAATANAAPTIPKPTEKPGPGGFIGLTNTDAFSSFLKSTNNNNTSIASNADANDSQNAENSNNDENFDPQFEPIIALPQEIVVSTGEEEETKLFGERATLFRWDDVNKEWKERGNKYLFVSRLLPIMSIFLFILLP